MPRVARLALASAAALLLGAATPARADLLRLFDGKTVEGKATLSSDKKKWTLKGYKGKSTTYAVSEVKFHEPAECSWDVAARMAQAIPADASDRVYVDGHLEIARYLQDREQYSPEMAELKKKEYELVFKKDAENLEARAALGYVRWGEWWFKSEKERDSFRKSAPPAQMEPKGYVKHRKTGLWETKEDAEAIDAGKVKFRGKWMTEDEKKGAEGYVKDETGKWVLARDLNDRQRAGEIEKGLGEKPVTVSGSEHFQMISWFPVGETAQLKELAEKVFAWTRETLGFPLADEAQGGEVMFADPIEVFLLVDGARKDRFVDNIGPTLGYDSAAQDHLHKGASWHRMAPFVYMVCSGEKGEKNRARDTEKDFFGAGSQVSSMAARAVLDRIRGGGTPSWFSEAHGLMAEIRFHETADHCYVTQTKYREEVANKEGSRAKYYDFMKAQVQSGVDRSFRQIFSLSLNDLDWADMMKAWSFVDFLRERYLEGLRKLVRQGIPEVEEIAPAHIQAAILAAKPKDPAAAAPGKGKPVDDSVPTAPIKVAGPGAVEVTEGSKEERAREAARSEAWLVNALGKDLDSLDAEWKAWLLAHR